MNKASNSARNVDAMYEVGARRLSLEVRKSLSMPMLIVDDSESYPESSKCPSLRCKLSTYMHRKAKSTISLCVGIVLCTFVLSVLTFALDLWKVSEAPRLLVSFPYKLRNHTSFVKPSDVVPDRRPEMIVTREEEAALEGMGVLYRKGKCGMPQIVVAHLSETTTAEDLKLFLRGMHRSGLLASADLVLLFPWQPLPRFFAKVIRDEERYFQRLLAQHHKAGTRRPTESVPESKLSIFNSDAYTKPLSVSDFGKGRQESVWGASGARNDSASTESKDDGVHYGAVIGFDMQELDPDDAFSGFLDRPSANLRRWVCYQILLGMVRNRYRHAMLTQVRGTFFLKNVLAPLKRRDPSLHLYHTGRRWADVHSSPQSLYNVFSPSSEANATTGVIESVYGKKFWNSLEEEDRARKVISTGLIVGGIRPVRSVAMAMATEIVRVALLRKTRDAFNPEAVLSFLVHKSSVLGKKVASHLQVHDSGMSPVNLLPGPPRGDDFNDFFRREDSRFAVLHGFKNEGVTERRREKILKSLWQDICNSQNDVEIYTDCYSAVSAPEIYSKLSS